MKLIVQSRSFGILTLLPLRQSPPDMTPLSLDQYLQLSPEEQARHDDLYRERLMDPKHRAFLAGLL